MFGFTIFLLECESYMIVVANDYSPLRVGVILQPPRRPNKKFEWHPIAYSLFPVA